MVVCKVGWVGVLTIYPDGWGRTNTKPVIFDMSGAFPSGRTLRWSGGRPAGF